MGLREGRREGMGLSKGARAATLALSSPSQRQLSPLAPRPADLERRGHRHPAIDVLRMHICNPARRYRPPVGRWRYVLTPRRPDIAPPIVGHSPSIPATHADVQTGGAAIRCSRRQQPQPTAQSGPTPSGMYPAHRPTERSRIPTPRSGLTRRIRRCGLNVPPPTSELSELNVQP